MEPGFPGGVVVVRLDRFLTDVDVPATETGNLLCQAVARLRHELVLATGPELIAMGDGPRHAPAGRLNGVLTDRLCVERRQFAMPVNDLGIALDDRAQNRFLKMTFSAHLANVGVHGTPVELHVEKLWDRNITLTTRLVDTVTTPMLLKVVQSGKLQPGKLVTHRFALDDVMKAYDTFGNAAKEGAAAALRKSRSPGGLPIM